jgi:hypothetical protein
LNSYLSIYIALYIFIIVFEYKNYNYSYLFCKYYRRDATNKKYKPGRYINHKIEIANGRNLDPISMEVDSIPRIMFIAAIDIPKGTELFFDYNERRKVAVGHNPWLGRDIIPAAAADSAANFNAGGGKIYYIFT